MVLTDFGRTAFETLIKNGFEPRRGIVLAFGFDEEIGGNQVCFGIKPTAKILITFLTGCQEDK